MAGMQKYTDIRVPVLAIFAVPHATGTPFKDDADRAAADTRDEATAGAQAKALSNWCAFSASRFVAARQSLRFHLE